MDAVLPESTVADAEKSVVPAPAVPVQDGSPRSAHQVAGASAAEPCRQAAAQSAEQSCAAEPEAASLALVALPLPVSLQLAEPEQQGKRSLESESPQACSAAELLDAPELQEASSKPEQLLRQAEPQVSRAQSEA